MPRYDESKIFDAYVNSLLVEKKEMTEKQKKFFGKKKDKKSDKSDDKRKSKEKGKKKNLPPWLKKKNLKESIVNEHHPEDDMEIIEDPHEWSDMTVIELLDELKEREPDLYRRLEEYLDGPSVDTTRD